MIQPDQQTVARKGRLGAIMALSSASLLATIEAKIDAALTPDVLSLLAFKGITPCQAREVMREHVSLGLAREFGVAA